MTPEESRIFAGIMFRPGAQELRDIKLRSHNLCYAYNKLFEDDTEERSRILSELFAEMGEGSFIQGPLFIHYGVHTHIGKCFFGNFNLTIQDDTHVTIGDYCNFGPNVTIVTPVHPLLPGERRAIWSPEGEPLHMCYAKPVVIGNDCWLGANVVVCPGVTIGDACVIGAGSVVTRDVPPHTFAAGSPCRPIRKITDADSMRFMPHVLDGYTVKPE